MKKFNNCYVAKRAINIFFHVIEHKGTYSGLRYYSFSPEWCTEFVTYTEDEMRRDFKFAKEIPEDFQKRIDDPFLEIDFERWKETPQANSIRI